MSGEPFPLQLSQHSHICIPVTNTASSHNKKFSLVIQIWWRICFALIQIVSNWSLQNFAHATTAVLSWHVQKFVADGQEIEPKQSKLPAQFELSVKSLVKKALGHDFS